MEQFTTSPVRQQSVSEHFQQQKIKAHLFAVFWQQRASLGVSNVQ